MSSPSLLSEFSPRIRNMPLNPSLLALNQQSRNALSRMLKRRTLKEEILSFYARQCEGMPNVPSYLSNSVYAHLVNQQYILFNKRLDNTKQSRKSLTDSTEAIVKRVQQTLFRHLEDERIEMSIYDQRSISSIERKIPSTQEYEALEALLVQDHFNLTLAIQDLRLPTVWDMRAKGDHVEVSQDRMQLTYKGSGKDDSNVSSVKANHAMRRQCGIYYFEIHVISKGIDGHIGIGFCRRINSLDRFPGWEEHSWGYHGENGKVYAGPGTGKVYGPKFGTGDIIGCGIDFRDMTAFYTKNGIYLGTAFTKIKETDIYPFVGFKTPGEKIEANFGSKPFKFDIKQYMSSEKRDLLNKIAIKPIESRKSRSSIINNSVANNISDKVVVEYLRHNGYNKSAEALEKAMKLKSEATNSNDVLTSTLDSEAIHRQDIRKSMLEGDTDRAIELCNTHYPSVLKENPWIEFKLQCRKFMEMVKQAQKNIDQPITTNDEYEVQSLAVSKNNNTIKRTTSKADVEVYNLKKKKQKICNGEQDLESLQAVMSFGNLLKQRYGIESESNESMKSELLATFSILAYSDLSNKSVAYLFETQHIEIVASELNSAILVSLDRYPNSSLERIYRQTTVAIEELVLGGNAKAALLEPERDCLNL